MKKKLVSLLLTSAMIVGMLAGCGNGDAKQESTSDETKTEADTSTEEESDTEEAADGEKITLNIAWWGNQIRNDATKKICDMYMEENENVEIKVEFMDWAGYWDKMSAMAAGGNLPDVYQHSVGYLNAYKDGNLMADLTPFIEDGTIDTTNIPDSIIESGSIDGKCYAISLGTNGPLMVYDPAVLEEAGVTLPERLTYENLQEIGEEVYQKTGVKTAYLTGTMVPEHLTDISRAMGHSMYDDIRNGDGEAALKYFQITDECNKLESSISLEVLTELTGAVEDNPIVTGKTWNTFMTSNMFVALDNACEQELGITYAPALEGAENESMFVRASQYFSIAETSQHKEEAAKFINWFTNSKECNDVLQGERGVPINTEILEGMKTIVDDATARTFDYVNDISTMAPGEEPYPNGYEEINTLIKTIQEDLYYGDINPEEATEELLSQGKRILDEAAK